MIATCSQSLLQEGSNKRIEPQGRAQIEISFPCSLSQWSSPGTVNPKAKHKTVNAITNKDIPSFAQN